MAYKVKKKVTEGDFFLEHQFSEFPQTFVGKWKKAGVLIENNPTTKDLTCSFCKDDWLKRCKINPCGRKLRSYRVVGVTEPDEFWEWEYGRCGNPTTCWGPRERIWDVRNHGSQWSFTHSKVFEQSEEKIEKLHAKLERGSGSNNLQYTGIAMKTSQSRDFWPNCLPVAPSPRRHIFITMASKEIVPPEYAVLPKNQWPKTYQTPKYLNPNRMECRYFDEPPRQMPAIPLTEEEKRKRCKEVPTTLAALEDSFPEIARTYIEMYPGGSGLKVTQYKVIQQEKNEGKHEKVDMLSRWYAESTYSGHMPGWAGPVVSYWARVDSNHRYFS